MGVTNSPPFPEKLPEAGASLREGAVHLGGGPTAGAADLGVAVAEAEQHHGPALIGPQRIDRGGEARHLLLREEQLRGPAPQVGETGAELGLRGDLRRRRPSTTAPSIDRPGAVLDHQEHPVRRIIVVLAVEVPHELHAGVGDSVLLRVVDFLGVELAQCRSPAPRARIRRSRRIAFSSLP
jgi:hypothetical protein